MNLATLVVYKLEPGLRPLLELHLERIAACTSVPYTIHAVAVDLPADLRERLLAEPHLRLHDLPPTDLTGGREHSHYLELLTERAFGSGATHAVTLHLDSFPLVGGWAEALAARLTAEVAFVSSERITTACLMFGREFWARCRPRYLPSAEAPSPRYERFRAEHGLADHSGIGYALAADRAGLRWSLLPCWPPPGHGARTYDGLIAHLGGAVRLEPGPATGCSVRHRQIEWLAAVARRWVPGPARRLMRQPVERLVDGSRQEAERAGLATDYARLLADPDGFLEQLRRARSAGAPSG